jgi:hypothetical protein
MAEADFEIWIIQSQTNLKVMKTKKLFLTVALLSPLCCLAEDSSKGKPVPMEIIIALLPAFFFLLLLIFILINLIGCGGFSSLLSEKDPSVKPVPADNAGTTTTAPKSASRLIAFLTGVVALTIGICMCTFYMYCYFNTPGNMPDLSKLSTVILGLGIGVIPYGTNQVSSALKTNKQQGKSDNGSATSADQPESADADKD